MENANEKFDIRISEKGLVITSREDTEIKICLTAGEALMLLDILKNEEAGLEDMARRDSPMPMRIKFE